MWEKGEEGVWELLFMCQLNNQNWMGDHGQIFFAQVQLGNQGYKCHFAFPNCVAC